ncbi:MAG TPA: FHA domain-containing protein [Kofleriaceae bacterium]|jgi:predicted component of type VI protein secretion system
MLRVEVSEEAHPALPPIDIADGSFVIGSAPTARVRLPANAARPEHVRVYARLGSASPRWRSQSASGEIGDGHTFEIGHYRVHVAPSPADAAASPSKRTESLARELVRSLLGANAAPSLEVERGDHAGAKRALAPPESVLVIGRGDDAGWSIPDSDLSKTHAEIRRGWDGVRVLDLGSKNGTRVDRQRVGDTGAELRDGALLELGKLALRYRDPAETHLGGPARETPKAAPRAHPHAAFYVAVAVAVVAVAGLVWLVVG